MNKSGLFKPATPRQVRQRLLESRESWRDKINGLDLFDEILKFTAQDVKDYAKNMLDSKVAPFGIVSEEEKLSSLLCAYVACIGSVYADLMKLRSGKDYLTKEEINGIEVFVCDYIRATSPTLREHFHAQYRSQ